MPNAPLSTRRAHALIAEMALSCRQVLTIKPISGGVAAEVGARPDQGEVVHFDRLPDVETLRARVREIQERRRALQ